MFPHFIESKNIGKVHVVLWQKNHYHYEIDVTGNDGYIQMPDTSFEDAKAAFDKFCEVK
jgi:hypothetical protein